MDTQKLEKDLNLKCNTDERSDHNKKINSKSKWLFLMYLFGFICMAMPLVLFQPLEDNPPIYSNPPDEHARFLIPRFICENGRIPTGLEEEIKIRGYGFSYGLYNTFPYIIQGFVMRFVNLFTDSETALLLSARMVNVIFGLVMAALIYLIAGKLFSDKRFQWLFSFAVMYLPQSMFLHTYINTDSCCLLSTAFMIYALLDLEEKGYQKKNCILLSVGIILCALSYYNAYGYILSSILIFISIAFKEKGKFNWKGMFGYGILVSVLVLLGIGWWFIRQYMVLDGDFLGLATRSKMEAAYALEHPEVVRPLSYQERGFSIIGMMKDGSMLPILFQTFVCTFGSMSMVGNRFLYIGYKLLFAGAIVGLLLNLVRMILHRKSTKEGAEVLSENESKEQLVGEKRYPIFFHTNMAFCMVMPFVLTVYYSYATDYQPQGRYLMPMLIPFFYYIVRGVEALAETKIGDKRLPGWLINFGLILCFVLIIGGTAEMVYHRALPVYLGQY